MRWTWRATCTGLHSHRSPGAATAHATRFPAITPGALQLWPASNAAALSANLLRRALPTVPQSTCANKRRLVRSSHPVMGVLCHDSPGCAASGQVGGTLTALPPSSRRCARSPRYWISGGNRRVLCQAGKWGGGRSMAVEARAGRPSSPSQWSQRTPQPWPQDPIACATRTTLEQTVSVRGRPLR